MKRRKMTQSTKRGKVKSSKGGEYFASEIALLLEELLEKMSVNKAEAAEVLSLLALHFEINCQCLECSKVTDASTAISLGGTKPESEHLTRLSA